MVDRLDLQIEVPALTSSELMEAQPGESSAVARERVLAARERQRARGVLNAMLPAAALKRYCALDGGGTCLFADAVDRGGMSARGVHRALRVARTIADLAAEEQISAVRLAERLRAAGYGARILAEAAQAAQITLRHGNFASRAEAESVRREISRLGVLTEVVQVR